ncbi:MAG: PHP domain-containing protein [Clostridia bacterium]|nr:PHP domain-containing protein [Clostridia bacterium]
MKKILLPEENEITKYYRANLHCHTKISDGRKLPAQIKEDYMAHGYSVVAFTDHDTFACHNELTDENFVALNGYELEADEDDNHGKNFRYTTHICYVALDPDRDTGVFHRPSKFYWPNKENPQFECDITLTHHERSYTPEFINFMTEKAHEEGFFVTYNHPAWSVESYPQYINYKGMDAMEISNYGCVIDGYDEDNGHCYDDFLRNGQKLYCIATDDNHNGHPDDSQYSDSYGGYVMIAADKLEYRTITKALKDGMFYSSTGTYRHVGPKILSLTFEDGKVTIKTSPAKRINLMTCRRRCLIEEAPYGEYVNEATFNVSKDDRWFRINVHDDAGYKAHTNAYFTEDLFE